MTENAVNTEMELAGSEALIPHDAALQEAMQAERSLWRAVMWGMVIAVPICWVIWVAMVAVAVGGKHPDWGAWIGIGIIVGACAGAFFGGWAAFLAKSHLLDDVDARAAHQQ